MSADSKTWIYASNRKFTLEEQNEIMSGAKAFTSNWKSHGQSLKASFDILYDTFIVLMVDESVNPVGGCGTDDSIHFIQGIESAFDVKLFNRLQVELLVNNEIIITSKSEAAKIYNESKISGNTIFFNKVITSKRDFESNFKIPYSKSWAFQGIKQAETV